MLCALPTNEFLGMPALLDRNPKAAKIKADVVGLRGAVSIVGARRNCGRSESGHRPDDAD